jgi:predicted nucleotidyltransferase
VPLLRKLPRNTGLGIEQVLDPRRGEIRRLVARHNAGRVRVFGSIARSAANAESDVDLLVEFQPGASGYDQVELIFDLQERLERRVDLTTEGGLHWLVRPQPVIEAVPL